MFLLNRNFVLAAIVAGALLLPAGASLAANDGFDGQILLADRKNRDHYGKDWKKGRDGRDQGRKYRQMDNHRDFDGHRNPGHSREDFNSGHRPGDHSMGRPDGMPQGSPGEMRGPGGQPHGMPGRHPGGPDFQGQKPGNFGGPASRPEGMRPGQPFPNGRPEGGMHPGAR